jgi:hypothetical protein
MQPGGAKWRFSSTRSILHDPQKSRKAEQFSHEQNWQKT